MMSENKNSLIEFDTIEKNLEYVHQINLGVQAIPVNKIVGSLGRYQDFNEGFLPHRENISTRYESVKQSMLAGKILPPIKVYQVLDNYFVIDGHHRVTVAKNVLHATDIDAEVVQIQFDLDLSTDKKYTYNTDRAKRFLIRLEEEVFQNKTFLRNTILVHPLKVTDLTSYAKLFEEMQDFRRTYNNAELAKKNIIFASYAWYEHRFLPTVRIILEEDILHAFPDRTYTDLYLWLQQHKYFLSQKAGYDVGIDFTKADFIHKFRNKEKVFDLLPGLVHDILRGIKKGIKGS